MMAACNAVRAVCMLVLIVASGVCSAVKMVVAEVCCEAVKSSSLVSLATWRAAIWAGVGGVGGVVVCAEASVTIAAISAVAARICFCMRV